MQNRSGDVDDCVNIQKAFNSWFLKFFIPLRGKINKNFTPLITSVSDHFHRDSLRITCSICRASIRRVSLIVWTQIWWNYMRAIRKNIFEWISRRWASIVLQWPLPKQLLRDRNMRNEGKSLRERMENERPTRIIVLRHQNFPIFKNWTELCIFWTMRFKITFKDHNFKDTLNVINRTAMQLLYIAMYIAVQKIIHICWPYLDSMP